MKQSIGTNDSAAVAASTFAVGKLSASRSTVYILSCLLKQFSSQWRGYAVKL